MMPSWVISATANLTETRQRRRRYSAARVRADIKRHSSETPPSYQRIMDNLTWPGPGLIPRRQDVRMQPNMLATRQPRYFSATNNIKYYQYTLFFKIFQCNTVIISLLLASFITTYKPM